MSDDDDNHLISERRMKLAKLRERGIAYPNGFRRNALAADLLTRTARRAPSSSRRAARVSVAGRMRAKRVMGKASFAKLEDERGDPALPAAASARRGVR
jgi:lysyl-tRNA synthetase class 2